jgi:prepilin-type N-terminal cleavage/methylation domain-containing protein
MESKFANKHGSMRPGLSLPELLIAITLLAAVSTLLSAIIFAIFRLFTNQTTSIDIASQNKIALSEITSGIRLSQAIVTTCPGSRCPQDTTGPSVIVLQLWSLDSSGEPISTAYDYMTYRQDPSDNTKLIRKTYPDATSSRITQTNVIAVKLAQTGLQFTYDNADVTQAQEVTITLTSSSKFGPKTSTITQSASAILRNK